MKIHPIVKTMIISDRIKLRAIFYDALLVGWKMYKKGGMLYTNTFYGYLFLESVEDQTIRKISGLNNE